MSANQPVERRLADYYQTEAPPRAPEWLQTRVLDVIDSTPQQRTIGDRLWGMPTLTPFARLTAGAVALVIVAVVGVTIVRQPAVGPAAELGIFAPVSGRILSGVWGEDLEAIDPTDPARSTTLRIGPESVLALGWSKDGTKLLFVRRDRATADPFDVNLFILHADGTETQVTPEPVGDAAISPDGSRVAFAASADDGLYVVDAEGGQPVRIASGEEPTFSPDGTQIAYLGLPRDGCCVEAGREHVWVANADGTDAHEVLADEPALAQGGEDLTWSPAGARIAMVGREGEQNAIYTFAPDGSAFTRVIPDGINPFWSPDGSRIAYLVPYGEPQLGRTSGLAIADADGSNVREFGFGASGPWHPGLLLDDAEAPASPSPSTPSASPSPVTLTPSPQLEAEQIIAKGTLGSFAATASGSVLTVWDTCHKFGQTDCAFAWRLGEGSRPQATGVVYPVRGVADSGDVFLPVAAADGFILTPPLDEEAGLRIAPDGTASSISVACRDVSWTTPTEPGRLAWTVGLEFVDTLAGTRCPASRLGGRTEGPPGVFNAEGTLWQLVDNEVGPDTLTIGRYDGKRWDYHDFGAPSGSWTSVLAATGPTVVVLLANPEPSPRPDRLVGFAVTTDAGATWSEVVDPDVLKRDLPFSAVVSTNDDDWFSGYTSMAFAGPSTLYVADGNGDLWRSTDLTTFSQVSVPGGVRELQSAGDAVIGRTGDGNDLVRISADGTVEAIDAR